MAWVKKRDPLQPVPPTYHHPERCMGCGHLKDEHDPEVGCLVEGGTKYMHDEESGAEIRACSCLEFIPAPEEVAAT